MSKAAAAVWSGPEGLRETLVPISDLEPFPGNPRRGDTDAVAASLRRFGQVKPIVVDGARIVAGHTLVRAAEAEGWTHVAASSNEFASEEEQRAFLLADNRSSDLSTYDDRLLLEQLRSLTDREGTGYRDTDLLVLEESLRELEAPPSSPTDDDHVTAYHCPSCGYQWSGSPRPDQEEEK